jgi:hypothetical protein
VSRLVTRAVGWPAAAGSDRRRRHRQIVDAFVAQSRDHRTARMLLATGPLVGNCSGSSRGVGHAWTRPVPTPAVAGFGAAPLAVLATLVASVTSRRSYRRN